MSTLRKSQMNRKPIYFTVLLWNDSFPLLPYVVDNIYTYFQKNSGKNLPIYVQVYYSFVDGIHIGEFVDSLEKYFANL